MDCSSSSADCAITAEPPATLEQLIQVRCAVFDAVRHLGRLRDTRTLAPSDRRLAEDLLSLGLFEPDAREHLIGGDVESLVYYLEVYVESPDPASAHEASIQVRRLLDRAWTRKLRSHR